MDSIVEVACELLVVAVVFRPLALVCELLDGPTKTVGVACRSTTLKKGTTVTTSERSGLNRMDLGVICALDTVTEDDVKWDSVLLAEASGLATAVGS